MCPLRKWPIGLYSLEKRELAHELRLAAIFMIFIYNIDRKQPC
jgi:hypothetical protein